MIYNIAKTATIGKSCWDTCTSRSIPSGRG